MIQSMARLFSCSKSLSPRGRVSVSKDKREEFPSHQSHLWLSAVGETDLGVGKGRNGEVKLPHISRLLEHGDGSLTLSAG